LLGAMRSRALTAAFGTDSPIGPEPQTYERHRSAGDPLQPRQRVHVSE
jgi:hypothetical protein